MQRHRYLIGEIGVVDHPADSGNQPLQQAVLRVRRNDLCHGAGAHLHRLAGLHRQRRTMRIRAHQPARAQQHPAEIAGHHHGAIGQPGFLQHIQYRNAGGALRFAVVRIAAHLPLPQDIGIHIVGCVPMRFFLVVDKRDRLLLGRDRADRPDKAGAALNKFILPFAADGAIGFHRVPPG